MEKQPQRILLQPKRPQPPRSIFVLSLPRSLSTRVYRAVCESLGLEQPVWTSDGECLNNDRFVLYHGPGADESFKFTRPEETERFQGIKAFLQQVTVADGFAYKDVVQPFVASAWLREQSFPVLKIRRPIEDVAYAMISRRWLYPARAFPRKNLVVSMLLGLAEAWKAIDAVPGETIDFEDLLTSEESVGNALRVLYPGWEPQCVSLRDPQFGQKTQEVLKRRETPLYRELAHEALALGF